MQFTKNADGEKSEKTRFDGKLKLQPYFTKLRENLKTNKMQILN
jgi:hypothetical protein